MMNFIQKKGCFLALTETFIDNELKPITVVIRQIAGQYSYWLFEIEVKIPDIIIAAKRLYYTKEQAIAAANFAVDHGYQNCDGLFMVKSQAPVRDKKISGLGQKTA